MLIQLYVQQSSNGGCKKTESSIALIQQLSPLDMPVLIFIGQQYIKLQDYLVCLVVS